MQVSTYKKYYEANRRFIEKNRDTINARKRERRLAQRKEKLKGKHCLNCDILLVARLEDKGRSYIYCRRCLTEYRREVMRHKWNRYSRKKKPVKPPKVKKERTLVSKTNYRPQYIVSWKTLKSL